MSRIGPREPGHWHDADGRHTSVDPRTYARPSEMTREGRAYARHLDAHAALRDHPEPLPGDPPAVLALIAHQESLRAIIKKESQLIAALRERQASYPDADALALPFVDRLVEKARRETR